MFLTISLEARNEIGEKSEWPMPSDRNFGTGGLPNPRVSLELLTETVMSQRASWLLTDAVPSLKSKGQRGGLCGAPLYL
jgi:hypothetical protein